MASFIEDVLDFLSTMGARRKDVVGDMSDYDDDLGFAIGPDAEYTPLGDMINLAKQKAPAKEVEYDPFGDIVGAPKNKYELVRKPVPPKNKYELVRKPVPPSMPIEEAAKNKKVELEFGWDVLAGFNKIEEQHRDDAEFEKAYTYMASVEGGKSKAARDATLKQHKATQTGKKTIGYGHELTDKELKTGLISVGGSNVEWRKGISEKQRREIFERDFRPIWDASKDMLKRSKLSHIPKGLQIALSSLIYNLGSTKNPEVAFEKVAPKAHRNLMAGNLEGFMYEAFDPVQGVVKETLPGNIKKIVKGLVNRRSNDLKQIDYMDWLLHQEEDDQ